MLIDTERLEDFMKRYPCDIDRKAEKLEDMIIYANRKTGRWESVYEQLKIDIALEQKWEELEDVLFIEEQDFSGELANGKIGLVLANDWSDYEAGTPQEYIWSDMFSKYSGGANLADHKEYRDTDKEFSELNSDKKFIIPDEIMDEFIEKKIAIKVNSKEQCDILLKEINMKYPLINTNISFDPRYEYYFSDDDLIKANVCMENLIKYQDIKGYIDFNDISKIFRN